MDFNATIDLIIKDLNEARDIIDDLRNYPGVPALQIELAKSKCKSASEVIALLKNIRISKPSEALNEDTLKTEDRSPETEDRSPKTEDSSPKPDAVNQKPPDIKPTQKKVVESSIFADTFSNLPDSLNKKLGSLLDDEDVSDILKAKQLTNLSEAIGVNDKFMFIRELFNGNHESYSRAISSLDEVKSLAEAKAIIMTYTGDNNETYAGKQLFDLVKRKFPGNE